ncbi:hypothetical protein CCO03_10150 [Comamonas serinivorans]|uniref:IPTL-CTERM protein sorting domain-containing protein n=1 Tax=Comamonas serinivorans TaxID=1082851 RepID=A0A1Y0EN29_9BURK|nr:IPTL-CTERM sorting domain-containing protein [Comamonas serinivorans]ARU04997.1 hypothetical protein CCO03_10150 [Comamonas serinivorans]
MSSTRFPRLLLSALLLAAASHAQAAYTVTFQQQGSNVVATGSGSFTVSTPDSAVELPQSGLFQGRGLPDSSNQAGFLLGDVGQVALHYGQLSSAVTELSAVETPFFGTSSGGFAGMAVQSNGICILATPFDYTSGASLNNTTTWTNTTLADMGLTAGSTLTFECDPLPVATALSAEAPSAKAVTANNVIVVRVLAASTGTTQAVPALGPFGLLALGAALGGWGVLRRRRANAAA